MGSDVSGPGRRRYSNRGLFDSPGPARPGLVLSSGFGLTASHYPPGRLPGDGFFHGAKLGGG